MPDMTANLHEKLAMLPYDFHPTLKGEAVSGSRYLPLCFTRFGGKDGQLLGSLSGIRGELSTAIIFTYESDGVPPLERSWPTGYGYRETEHPYFEIDSKGGERFVRAILTIEGDLKPNEDPFIYGVLSSATLITDRGWEYELCNYGLQYGGPLVPFELSLPSFEVITGIYGVPGGMSLGIVSEKVID
ncbi:unnamed protein product [Clonostachys solani]|uniref:Uncharacterized protein n=1 Tax=Clonostachys solani TaxID=160281 RepID=A0A9P0EMJ1_9HYPO|nr:unnamed protein product [Clonostachys solani]